MLYSAYPACWLVAQSVVCMLVAYMRQGLMWQGCVARTGKTCARRTKYHTPVKDFNALLVQQVWQ
jgi:hypothetical protein